MTKLQNKNTVQTSKKRTRLLIMGTSLEAISIGFAIVGINISSLGLTFLSLAPALFAVPILKKLQAKI